MMKMSSNMLAVAGAYQAIRGHEGATSDLPFLPFGESPVRTIWTKEAFDRATSRSSPVTNGVASPGPGMPAYDRVRDNPHRR